MHDSKIDIKQNEINDKEDEEYNSKYLNTVVKPPRTSNGQQRQQTANRNTFYRPKTSNYSKRNIENSQYIGKPKHVIDQCIPPINLKKNKEEIISNLPSARNLANMKQNDFSSDHIINGFDEKQMMMSLYKIKIPTQILNVLKRMLHSSKPMHKLNSSSIGQASSPHNEKHLSPRFGKRASSLYVLQSNKDLKSVQPNMNINRSTDIEDYKDMKPITKATILANQEELYNQSSQGVQESSPQQKDIFISSQSTQPQVTIQPQYQLQFNIKLTDLSDLENPFVIYENKKIDDEGYIIFDNFDLNILNPSKIFPWLSQNKDLEKRTLKIEVTFMHELVLLRFIHLDKFYPIKFAQIMLEISNNMQQNQILLNKQSQAYKKDEQGNLIKQEEEGVLIMKKIEIMPPPANLLQNEKVKQMSIDHSKGEIEENGQSLTRLGPNQLMDTYFALKPSKNQLFLLLQDVKNYRVNLKDLKGELEKRQLLEAPQELKQLRIIIEFTDCIIQAKDMTNYHILIDDNRIDNVNNNINQNGYQKGIISGQQIIQNNAGIYIKQQLQYNRPYSQGRPFNQHRNSKDFNPILLGSKLSTNKPNTLIKSLDPKKASLLQHYAKNRSVQFYVRKGLDDQVAQNRKIVNAAKPLSAAVNMRDNKKIFSHLNEAASFQTKPMNIKMSSNSTNYLRSTKMTQNTQSYYDNYRNKINTFNRPFLDTEKGEIDIGGESVVGEQYIMDAFQSVKSYGLMNSTQNQQELGIIMVENEQKEYMNFPYSRTQDYLGASMATPSYFFKDSVGKKTVRDVFYMKRDQYNKRPGTQGDILQNPYGIQQKRPKFQNNSLTYFDDKDQIFGILGTNNFN